MSKEQKPKMSSIKTKTFSVPKIENPPPPPKNQNKKVK
ncbi:hypothetical protein SAMN05216490_3480 [Mucilaginibacter mallensis]|uniref:Uncharacterized protein n=1 Tax=Mucilaginibacter mallensis TaxID=652787 RepID=A0A1H2ACZ4_MUCMA|nr:hypothetical protein SAMN05216490_3480 [Mucilaginibacter mallensis]